MSYNLIASTTKGVGPNGGTTDAINTSGANLLLVFEFWFDQIRDPDALSDNKSNTWTTIRTERALVDWAYRLSYVNGVPTVGTNHTFTSSTAGGNIFNCIAVLAFSGAKFPFEVEAHNSAGTGTTLQPGSVTPAQPNSLITSFLGYIDTVAATINGGFTRETSLPLDPGVSGGCATAYLIQSGAPSAANPTWTWTNSGLNAGINVVFTGSGGGAPAGKGQGKGNKGGGGVNVQFTGGTNCFNIGNPGLSIGYPE